EKGRGFYTTEPFSEPELFEFPEGIGVIECVNVEHEEVVLVPREIDCRRVTFKYGLGNEFIEGLKTLHKLGLHSTPPLRLPRRRGRFRYGRGNECSGVRKTRARRGLDSTRPVRWGGVEAAPWDMVAAALPDPATLGDRMRGKTCAGTLVTGMRKDGGEGAVYL